MPIVRLNATDAGVKPGSFDAMDALTGAGRNAGPMIVLLHGYKYLPDHPRHCPHKWIYAAQSTSDLPHLRSWPTELGFGDACDEEGLCLAFGWNARGALWTAQAQAQKAGAILAQAIQRRRAAQPDHPVHILAHSMGTEVALAALERLPAGAIGRVVSLTGASYGQRAMAALESPAGRNAEFFNIVSRENDAYDFLFERLIAPPRPGDRSIGNGVNAPNALTLQIDCAETLAHLHRIGAPVAPPSRRICHWSSYTRPGLMRFYAALFRKPGATPMELLRRGLPPNPAPRWSRLVSRPAPGRQTIGLDPQVHWRSGLHDF